MRKDHTGRRPTGRCPRRHVHGHFRAFGVCDLGAEAHGFLRQQDLDLPVVQVGQPGRQVPTILCESP
ncbi:hypothetical protein DS843_15990 [Roseomonas genomospecies 6]|uniref:Uncharacterized protein n=1 Tax=Roseomonas genomospecies 6 TaxID=214106 RepID=A0A9W7TYC9_9PROT|nr:hypothetical protein DS843_15990 [Roseomonas genomospecies 6]